MPKEDAQLIAPISYDDPSSLWGVLGDHLRMQLPLRDLVVKSPLTGHSVTIASLPLRFMPASAPLFKDTNHPFRWFLAFPLWWFLALPFQRFLILSLRWLLVLPFRRFLVLSLGRFLILPLQRLFTLLRFRLCRRIAFSRPPL